MEIYLLVTFIWSMIFNGLFIWHVVHSKRNEEPWSRPMLVLNIFFSLLWILPLLWCIALLFAIASSGGLTSM